MTKNVIPGGSLAGLSPPSYNMIMHTEPQPQTLKVQNVMPIVQLPYHNSNQILKPCIRRLCRRSIGLQDHVVVVFYCRIHGHINITDQCCVSSPVEL